MALPVQPVPTSASAPVASAHAPVNSQVRNVVLRSIAAGDGHTPAVPDNRCADIFQTGSGQPRVLRGVCIYGGSTRLAELASRIGFETVWIEMEHGPADFNEVEALCVSVEVGGGLPAVRVPDSQRHHILRALEVGARIVIVPMVNTPEQARQLVEFGKFPPLGSRGYNVRSRGVNYGLDNRQMIFSQANQRTHIFAQIESMQAVENLDEICQVEGLSGVFIGPGDLSVSLGIAGNLDGERMIQIVTDCTRRARAAGKHVGILVPPGALLDAALAAGCDLVYYGGDVTELTNAWRKLLDRVPATEEAPQQ